MNDPSKIPRPSAKKTRFVKETCLFCNLYKKPLHKSKMAILRTTYKEFKWATPNWAKKYFLNHSFINTTEFVLNINHIILFVVNRNHYDLTRSH